MIINADQIIPIFLQTYNIAYAQLYQSQLTLMASFRGKFQDQITQITLYLLNLFILQKLYNLDFLYLFILILLNIIINIMDKSKCDCPKEGSFTLLCIQQECKLKRRLCGICRRLHSGHEIIQYDDPQSFNVYSINIGTQKRQKTQITLQKAHEIASFNFRKIQKDIEAIKQEFTQIFHNWISRPFEVLIGTFTESYQEQIWKMTASKQISSQQISDIGRDLRILSKPCFKEPSWLIGMSQLFTNQILEIRQNVEKYLQQTRAAIMNIKFLSPFHESLDQLIQQKQREIRYSNNTIDLEQEKTRFLNNFKDNVIGFITTVSVQNWKKSKKLEQIEQLNLEQKNLKEISPQLKYFSELKKLRLSGNNIREIQNLDYLVKLEVLYLQNNKISEIRGLEKLIKVNILHLWKNNISQIKGLESLINLQVLRLDHNPIQEIKNLDNLNQLQQFVINNCKISKLEGVNKLNKLKHLWIQGNPLLEDQSEKQKIEEMKKKGTIKIYVKNSSQ